MASKAGLTRRRRADAEGDGQHSSSSSLSADDDKHERSPKLTLLEEVLLLGLKDNQALRGCIILELSLRQKVVTTKETKRRPFTDRVLQVVDDTPTGEVLLDEALRLVKSDQQSIGNWIDLLSGETWNLMKVGYQLKQVRERIAKGLVDKGVLRTEKKNFVLFDMATHPLADATIKAQTVKKVVDVLLGRGPEPDARTISLVCAAYAANVIDNALANLPYEQKEAAFQKVDDILQQHAQLTEKVRSNGTTDVMAGVFSVYSKQFRRMTTLVFGAKEKVPLAYLFVGEKSLLKDASKFSSFLPTEIVESTFEPLFRDLGDITAASDSQKGATATNAIHKLGNIRTHVAAVSIPSARSRNNAIVRVDSIAEAVKGVKDVDTQIVVALEKPEQAFAAGCAIARCFPLYSRKSTPPKQKTVYVDFAVNGSVDYARIQQAANGIRLAARLTDMPASELHTDAYVAEVQSIAQTLEPHGVKLAIKQGKTLVDEGFGGLVGVGKAAEHGPALVHLSYTPSEATKNVVMVGKGIVYDTGGLSLKTSQFMPDMKCDMAGSAGILGAFVAAVHSSPKVNLHAILCLAENSVCERSTRPDDILDMYSGKTVEVNNTDAEGRLVLADGVAYATKHLNPDIVIDMATLTGAQAYATGKVHAGVLTNKSSLESIFVEAGRSSGDLVFPLLYAPEFLSVSKQFVSECADMKNSVKDRANASSSCAGHFIEEHLVGDKWKWDSELPEDQKGGFVHLDIAAPAFVSGRGTGYGVGLLLEALQKL